MFVRSGGFIISCVGFHSVRKIFYYSVGGEAKPIASLRERHATRVYSHSIESKELWSPMCEYTKLSRCYRSR